jgi:hypothetical protein
MRQRLTDLQTQRVPEHERPMHEIALNAVRTALTEIGRELSRLSLAW